MPLPRNSEQQFWLLESVLLAILLFAFVATMIALGLMPATAGALMVAAFLVGRSLAAKFSILLEPKLAVSSVALLLAQLVAYGILIWIVTEGVFNLALPPPLVLAFLFCAFVSCLGFRAYLQRRSRGASLQSTTHLLVVGANAFAVAAAQQLVADPGGRYHIVGFAEDDVSREAIVTSAGYSIVTGLANIPNFLASQVVDEILIALPMRSQYDAAERLARHAMVQGVSVRCIRPPFNPGAAHWHAGDAGSLTLRNSNLDRQGLLLKRMLDLVLATVAIVLLIPVWLLVPIAIKLDSKGPALFRQTRVGLNKRNFTLFKYRTMQENAESRMAELEQANDISGPVFKMHDDPRITSLGKFLRKSSIDELPQLFNVLKGEMSIVGPRPLPLRDYAGFTHDGHRRRLSVPQGITGLWQISGRTDVSFDEWMALDLQYVDSWSIWLDLKIIVSTPFAMCSGKGAY